ncbi:MAG: D-alanyl-D-alanine carboxypeptidase/D-alanyl-D-alanine-endopeptidase [Paludibacterium sp.]|uniref:D-alanyl-D-alanine carboxypeptidase/D-alanyl-D-alanine endopeptidase n=1 Tax=Paludibacterium sp. TaxID=1917523 RepID=UPI0025D84643|nr:D-alanyl-D-alanine carboxypeptidase/D-alanyl-D-alanine-endopeptidase [Paludibacterium sp.]MBV8048170.1 D-alanyl-D-alanine carboxypeptidase/D-alanyl-D-alanine-endopeptidase [Paludibacterium sp.]MBV8645884.1 D-alanyl-D-alanine carboxypeptidase/D-alanyl-D-alanine-endopeptidase [Paludibacterium sp.]
MRNKLLTLAAMLLYSLHAGALDLHGLPPDSLALWAAPVESATVTAAYRDDVAVQPASTMKLLTTWAALTRLGPDFTWQSRLVSTAPVVGGTLAGDLYWVGEGDPRFFGARLRELLDGLRQRGIQRIAGRLVLDASAYTRLSSAGGFEEDEGETFMAPPDPLLTNLNVVWLRFFNDAQGPRVALDPPLANISLTSRLTDGGDAACGDVRRWVRLAASGGSIAVSGQLPRDCDGRSTYLQPLPPAAFSAAAFSGLWQALAGGGPEGVAAGRAPAGARVLAEVTSDPLARVLPDVNKFSNNPMARSLFLTLGRVAPASGDTVADADRAVRETLAAHALSDRGLTLENGSGLSRSERLPVRLLGEVLREAARGPYAAEFLASLPLAGQTGTLKHRFVDLGPALRLKTGTLKDVVALAGYWQGADGRRLAIVAVVNHPDAARLKPALDAVVRDVIRLYEANGV